MKLTQNGNNKMLELLQNNNSITYEHNSAQTNAVPVEDKNYHFDEMLGSGTIRSFQWSDIIINFVKTTLSQNLNLNFENKGMKPIVKMIFLLQGNNILQLDQISSDIILDCNRHNIIYIPSNNKGKIITNACSKCISCSNWSFFEVNISPNFFKRFLPSDKLLTIFKKQIEQNQAGSLYPQSMNISLQMHEIINDIVQCPHDTPLKNIRLESKVIELLYLQLNQLMENPVPVAEKCKRTEIEKIYKAREILMRDISNPCSLVELALKVGTNECTLKKVFKEVFGYTVYGYVQETRMKYAKKLLLEGKTTVTEAAESVGYKNATHFTSAFKKHFGVLPSKMLEKV